jgi:hypothetical protein
MHGSVHGASLHVRHLIEESPTVPPVRHQPVQEPPEARAMVVFLQMTEFVEDHVVDSVLRRLEQLHVQDDLLIRTHYPS